MNSSSPPSVLRSYFSFWCSCLPPVRCRIPYLVPSLLSPRCLWQDPISDSIASISLLSAVPSSLAFPATWGSYFPDIHGSIKPAWLPIKQRPSTKVTLTDLNRQICIHLQLEQVPRGSDKMHDGSDGVFTVSYNITIASLEAPSNSLGSNHICITL